MTKPASAPPADATQAMQAARDCLTEYAVRAGAKIIDGDVYAIIHGLNQALAASAQVREVEPKYFDDVLHPDDPRRSDYAKPARV